MPTVIYYFFNFFKQTLGLLLVTPDCWTDNFFMFFCFFGQNLAALAVATTTRFLGQSDQLFWHFFFSPWSSTYFIMVPPLEGLPAHKPILVVPSRPPNDQAKTQGADAHQTTLTLLQSNTRHLANNLFTNSSTEFFFLVVPGKFFRSQYEHHWALGCWTLG